MSIATNIIAKYCLAHERALSLTQKLSDEQFQWRPTPAGHSIAFHLWHMARWADHLQAAIPGMTPQLGERLGSGTQIWTNKRLAAQWGFDAMELGYEQTGMSMSDEIAAQLSFPPKQELLEYAQQVFSLAECAVSAIDDDQFQAIEQPQPLTEGIWGGGTVGDAILAHLIHDNRHLGMMECLNGLGTGSGTATV
jgi:hypothetical protein